MNLDSISRVKITNLFRMKKKSAGKKAKAERLADASQKRLFKTAQEFAGHGSFKTHLLACYRMPERQDHGMQPHPSDRILRRSVLFVTNNAVPDIAQMDADLVFAATFQGYLQQ